MLMRASQKRWMDSLFLKIRIFHSLIPDCTGSGKSTLLSVFAGSCRLSVHGDFVGGFSIKDDDVDRDDGTNQIIQLHEIPAPQVAYLQQHDDFFTQLTVQETLDLAAYLEMPHLHAHERHERIRQTVSYLGLSHCTHRPIGSVASSFIGGGGGGGGGGLDRSPATWFWKRKRIVTPSPDTTSSSTTTNHDPYHSTRGGRLSGGERRRLSVALELLTNKELLLADEPTSGLDAAFSVVVMKLLGDLARSRHIPAIISLHQPRSSIWMNLDALILLAPGGNVCYAGSRETAVPYFQSLGYKLPANTNPAEFLVDLVSIDSEDAEQAARDLQRIDELASHFEAYQQEQWKKQSSASSNRITEIQYIDTPMLERGKLLLNSRSLWRWIPRVGALLRRSWRQNVRDVHLNLFRFVANIGNAMLLAGIFPTVQGPIPTTSSIADRVALLSFGAVNLCMMAYMKTIQLFAQERPVIEREQIRDQYTAAEYLLAKVLAEIPVDAGFSAVFTTVLKKCTGLQISWQRLTSVFALLTTAGASMGFFIGSMIPSEQYAASAGIPMLVVLMIVGVINPSGVDPTKPKPLLVRWVKELSPFASAIEALCIGEYPGVRFQFPKRGISERLRNIPRMGGLALVSVSSNNDFHGMLGQRVHAYIFIIITIIITRLAIRSLKHWDFKI
jgi:ABC-type multidrug transport system ATPase subunit